MIDGTEYFQGRTVHFYMILSRDCNLKCPFCYQPESFRDKKKMDLGTSDTTMNWIFNHFDDSKIKVMLWGGEPFTNLPVLEHLVEKYPQIRFTVVTNGYLIDKKLRDKLVKYHNLYISLSIANAKNEFPDYLKKLSNAIDVVVQNGGDVHYVSSDPKGMYDEYIKMENLGIPMIRLSIPRDVDISEEQMLEIESEWKRIIDHVYFEKNFGTGKTNFDRGLTSNIVQDIKGRPFTKSQPYFCGCGYLYLSIDTNGDVYPCDWFCGLEKLKFGNIYNGIKEGNVRMIANLSKNKDKMYKDFCRDCEIPDIRLCPRAMCLAENLETTGCLTTPQKSHCRANILEYRVHRYLVERAMKEGKIK